MVSFLSSKTNHFQKFVCVLEKSDEIILFCHGIKNKFTTDDQNYLKLKCDSKGKFVSVSTEEKVKPNTKSCKKPLDPEIIKVPGKTTSLCANVGADERKTDLEGNINLYQIGWNTSSLKGVGVEKSFVELVRYILFNVNM